MMVLMSRLLGCLCFLVVFSGGGDLGLETRRRSDLGLETRRSLRVGVRVGVRNGLFDLSFFQAEPDGICVQGCTPSSRGDVASGSGEVASGDGSKSLYLMLL